MYQTFAEGFEMAIAESCSECIVQNRKQNSEYQQSTQTLRELYKKLRKKLGEEENLVTQLQDMEIRCSAIQEDWIYRQGFRDCLFLLKWAGVIRIG